MFLGQLTPANKLILVRSSVTSMMSSAVATTHMSSLTDTGSSLLLHETYSNLGFEGRSSLTGFPPDSLYCPPLIGH